MPRHRRTTSGNRSVRSWNADEFDYQSDKVEILRTCQQLKNDNESLRLEMKLSQQIQRLLDKRLSELATLPSSDNNENDY